MSNRPLPPAASGITDRPLIAQIGPWTYFDDEDAHCLIHWEQSSNTWETVIDISGSGVLLWDIAAVKNAAGADREIRHKLTIDSNVVVNRSETIPDGQQRGIAVAGLIIFQETGTNPAGCQADYIPFETQLKIESYSQNVTNFDISVNYQYLLT